MTYTLSGCIRIRPADAEAAASIVDAAASYVGENPQDLACIFADGIVGQAVPTFVAACFPGITLDLPPSVVVAVEAALVALGPLVLTPWFLTRTVRGVTSFVYLGPEELHAATLDLLDNTVSTTFPPAKE